MALIIGTSGNDTLVGTNGDDTIDAGNGNDLLSGGAGSDVLDGGNGDDTVTYDEAFRTEGVYVDLTGDFGGTYSGGENDTLVSIENVTGTDYDDYILGDGNDNQLSGGNGDDFLWGGGGADTLSGGDGNDILIGTPDPNSTSSEVLLGGNGDDYMRSGAGDDYFDGGAGNDRVSYYLQDAGVTVDLNLQGSAQNTGAGMDTLVNIEALSGSNGDDTFIGDGNDNWLWGNNGNDSLAGGAGNDLFWGDGSEVPGNDTMDGGAGIDTVDYSGNNMRTEGVYVDLTGGFGGTASGGENDILISIENVTGTDYDDYILGDGNDNQLSGGGGADFLWGGGGADSLSGGDGNDILIGNEDPASTIGNVLLGGNGDDYMRSGAGDDYFDGGAGNDRVSYYLQDAGVTVDLNLQGSAQNTGAGMDTLVNIEALSGSNGDDTFIGDGNDNWLWGNNGNDSLVGGAGNDLFWGDGSQTLGNDTMDGGAGIDTVDYSGNNMRTEGVYVDLGGGFGGTASGGENDILISIENVTGTDFNDTLLGDTSDSLLSGGNGDDLLGGGAGSDVLDGGNGDDTVTYDEAFRTEGVYVDLGGGFGGTYSGGENDTLISIENVTGTDYDDYILGDGNDNQLSGGGGADFLWGGGGADTLSGGDGNDILIGNEDPASTIGNVLLGGNGDDYMRSGAGDDYFDGGAGNDRVSYYLQDAGVTVDLNLQGSAQNTGAGMDTLVNIEALSGSNGDDTFIGDGNDNWLWGNNGNDSLAGGDGNDLFWGDGSQSLGNDTMDGGAGIDTVDYSGNNMRTEGVYVDLAAGTGGTASGGETDTLISIENVDGTNFDDTILGGADDNTLSGYGGDDVLSGAKGDDLLLGEMGNDSLNGGKGDDTLNGGDGNDVLDGGKGKDFYVFDSPLGSGNIDHIVEFDNPGKGKGDIIQLDSNVFDSLLTGPGHTLGSAEFLAISGTPTGMDGSASTRIIYDSDHGALYYDYNGAAAGGLEEFATLSPDLHMTADDFFVTG